MEGIIGKTGLVDILNRVLELFRVYRRLFRDLYAMSPGRVTTVLFYHTVGPFLMGCMIMVLTGAVRIITRGQGGDARPSKLDSVFAWLEPNLTGFAIVGIVVTVLGGVGAYLCWKAMYISRKIARDYRVSVAGTLIEKVGSFEVETSDLSLADGAPANLSSMFLQGPLQSGMAARLLLTVVRPVVMILCFFVILLFLSWQMTMVMLPLLLIPLPLIYALNRSTHGASHRFYLGGGRKKYSAEIKNSLSKVNQTPVTVPAFAAEVRNSYANSKDVNKALDDYDFSILARTRSQYYTSVFQALLIGVGVFGFGLAAIKGWLSWEIIIGALIALKGLQQGVTTLWGITASLVRKFPVVRNTRQFISKIDVRESVNSVVCGTSQGKSGSSKETARNYLIASPIAAVRTTVPGLLDLLRQTGERMDIQAGGLLLVTRTQAIPEQGDWIREFDKESPVSMCYSLPGDERQTEWEKVAEFDRCRALILAGISTQTRSLILQVSPVCALKIHEEKEQLIGAKDLIFVCRGWPGDSPLSSFSKVIAHDGETIVREAPGDDWADHRGMLDELLRKSASDFDDSDLDEDDDE